MLKADSLSQIFRNWKGKMDKKTEEITEQIYNAYGTDSGVLFGIPPHQKECVKAIVKAVLARVNFQADIDREAVRADRQKMIDDGYSKDWSAHNN